MTGTPYAAISRTDPGSTWRGNCVSKLDANSGFWQIEFTKQSSLLATFITPFDTYHFNLFPFGITSAPEHFQRCMSEVLQGLEGVVCLIDDILIYGKAQTVHGKHLNTEDRRSWYHFE